jgi:hypothetical protein
MWDTAALDVGAQCALRLGFPIRGTISGRVCGFLRRNKFWIKPRLVFGTAGRTTKRRVRCPPGFPVRLGGGNELHAAFLIESRTRAHGWGRAVGNPGPLRSLQRVGYATVGIEIRGIPPFAKNAKDGAPGDLLRFLPSTKNAPFHVPRVGSAGI